MKKSFTLVGFVVLMGCARAPEPTAPPPEPFKVVATVKQVMHGVTIPASDAIWKVPSEAPKNDEAWLAVESSGYALAESGNLLLMKGRAREGEEWIKFSQQLVDVGVQAAEAVHAKDMDKIMAAGDAMYAVCENCHMKYMPQPQPPK